MALQVNNYQLPQGVVLPAAYLKITEATVRMADQPPDAKGVVTTVPVATVFFKVYTDATSRLDGLPPFPDTPSVVLTNPAPAPSGALVDQLYGGLAAVLGVPNTVV